MVQLTPKCLKRPVFGEESYIKGYHVYMIIWKSLVDKCLQCLKEPTKRVDKNAVAVACANFHFFY